MKRKILLIGTFDTLHGGHVNLFYNASKLGEVFVGVTSDRLNKENPEKDNLFFDENKRIKMIEPISFVNKVFLIEPQNGLTLENIVKENEIDALVCGSDYKDDQNKINLAKRLGVEFIILPRTEEISSSDIRKNTWN